MSAAPNLPSEVKILKTREAAKKGTGGEETEVIWPKPEFGPSTTIDNVTDKAKAEGFIVPAGSMFPLISLLDRTRSFSADLNYGAAIPRSTLMHGAYFPPGTMFPQGVLVPIHARMVSVQPIQTFKPKAPPPEPVCCVQ
ncbi:hypothetical protein EHS25_009657 [Saitozyma podzolica]|uniref:Uncharacterized protein n=1 Tax=Saitozyma podzolica TaxID=1890683 RepID=A0A427YJT9_9TREE|nr:hypothetical protein EHS25_009657 [Saitozyma podzolica]